MLVDAIWAHDSSRSVGAHFIRMYLEETHRKVQFTPRRGGRYLIESVRTTPMLLELHLTVLWLRSAVICFFVAARRSTPQRTGAGVLSTTQFM
jgi:hypothetical protein